MLNLQHLSKPVSLKFVQNYDDNKSYKYEINLLEDC